MRHYGSLNARDLLQITLTGDATHPSGSQEASVDNEHISSYLREHQLQGDVLSFDIKQEVEELQQGLSSVSDDRIAKTLVKEGLIRVTLIALKAGAAMPEHDAPGPCTVHFMTGTAAFTSGGKSYQAGPGSILAFDTRVAHSVTAETDCSFLLTIAMSPVRS
ncbi:MAG: cupin domain-containing protein [Chloroflexota bacterium]